MSLDEKNLYPIGGQGGSGGGSTPSEDPDTLQSHTFVSVIDLLGEGQIGGLVGTNTVEKEKSIYIDGTPMRTNGGTENFKGVSWTERTGTQDQSYIDGYGGIETPTSINVQLKFNVPKVISITNSRVDEVRIILAIGGLMVTESDGDIRGSSVNFSIGMATNSGASSEVAARAIKGKASSRYQVAYVVKLPKVANDGTPITRWDIQVTRTTSDSTEAGTQDDLYFDSYSEVITKKLTYPNSALVATRVNSEHFSSMPKREYLVDGLLIKVPSNYNHVTREYTGIWDGSFKLAPTSNPAWIMFDILTNNRYGLGEYIDAGLVDEARLYQIGRYCDQMVDDGFGNLEPRYTVNCTINSRAEAYDLITDICSAFNGMSYWAGGQVGFTIDAPSDPVMAFTSANIEGEFSYSGTSVKDRHSIAVVTYNDPKDDYKQAVEYVEDPDLIERYGVRKIEIQAFGCTSRAQAHRYGRWILYTEHQQSEVCSFTAGMDASTLMPGSIVQIQDEHRAGKRFGGRLLSCTATSAILDDDIDFTGFETGLKFAVMLSDGSFVEREIATKVTRTTVIGTTGNTHTATEVTWVTPLENLPVSQAVWVISAPNLELVQARVVGVKQGVDLDKFDISVIPHNPNKYAAIEKNVMLEVPPTSILSSRNQVPPSEVRIKQEVLVHQGLSKTRLVIDWERADKAIRYSVEWKRDEDNWVRLPETANLSAEVEDVYTGTYIARVTAIGMSGARSYPQYSVSADLTGKSGNLALPVAFEAHGILFGMEMSWAYPANSKDSSHVVIEVSDTNNVADAKLLAAVPYPATTHTVTGLMGNLTQYYRIKLVDKSGNESEFTPFVSAKTLEDPEILIEMLSGHVDKIVLSPEVVDQIEQATADNAQNRADLLAETAARIAELQATQNDLVAEVDARTVGDATEAAARAAAIASEAAARATDIATEAEARATDIASEAAARSTAITTAIATEAAARSAAIASEAAARATDIATEAEARIAGDATEAAERATAIASAIASEAAARSTAIAKEATDRAAALTAESTARANAIMAEETARNAAINAKVAEINTNIATQIDAVQDGIDQEVIDRTDAVNTVRGELNTYKTSNDSAVATALQKVEAVTTAHDATVTELDALQSSFEDLTGDLSATTSDLSSFKQTVANADAALGTRIDNLTTTVNTNNTAVNGRIANVETSITTLESNVNTKTSQLQSSLNTTNTNVTAATNAANAANTLAGGKGKVLFQSTAPAAADRLSQNLWIDTTSGTNTPKRWNGTAWVAVTDKIATDALAAANAATATVATKADASAVDTLTTRVTTAESTITSTSTKVTNLENSVNHATTGLATKASTSALNTLDGKVTTIDGKVTANTSDITALQNRVTLTEDDLETKADGQALTDLTTRVTATEGSVSTQGQSITSLQGSLATTNTNVGTAQTTANAKGKVIYSTTAPATADRLTQNLWIDTTNNANTPKRWNGTAWVAVTDKVASDALAAANTANTTVATKADSSAVTALINRVTTAEGTITTQGQNITTLQGNITSINDALATKASGTALSDLGTRVTATENNISTQSQSITSLEGSLSTTNTNVTAAQNAANAANTLAGGKGKVLYQSTAPATADRLSQNLWIDTTGNTNTPKRWNGTAWVAVTDKVATDALAAANAANTAVATKADASAVNTLTTRVTTAEGTITSQGTRVTNLENSVNHATTGLSTKASTSALNTLDGKVTTIDGKTTANTNDITSLSGRVTTVEGTIATKADASALNNIYTKTQTDAKAAEIAAGQISQYDANLSIGGTNLLLNSEDERTITNTISGELFIPYYTIADGSLAPNTTYTLSVDLKSSEGNTRTTDLFFVRTLNTQHKSKTNIVTTTAWVRYTFTFTTGDSVDQRGYIRIDLNATSVTPVPSNTLYSRRAQLEIGNKATDWSPAPKDIQASLDANSTAIQNTNAEVSRVDGVATAANNATTALAGRMSTVEGAVATKAEASALTALTTRVTNAEGVNTSQGTAITTLQNTVNHATTGLASKASSSALTAVDNKVTAANGRIDTTNSNVTALTGRVSTVEGAVSTKAEASALTALTTRVTNAEGVNISQGSAITTLQNDLATTNSTVATKASTTALNTLDSKVTSVDGKATTNASAITALQGKMTTVENGLTAKADSSALVNYSTKTATDAAIAAATTALKASLGLYALPTDKDTSQQNKWARITLRKTQPYITNSVVPDYSYIGTYPEHSEGYFAEGATTTLPIDNSINYYRTLINVAAASTINLGNLMGDDAHAIYVDGKEVYRKTAFSTNACSFEVTAGDHVVDIVVNNGTGGAGFSSTITMSSQVTSMYAPKLTGVLIGNKAEASAVTALDTRVTSAEGVNTAQSTSITALENSVNHATTGLSTKASSSALTAVDNKVTAANGRIDTTNSNVSTLTGRVSTVEGAVATKAEAAALTALTTRVTNAEGVNTSQGTAITTLQNTVNHATTGLATKASTSALTATNSEVSRVNGVVTGHTNQLTQLAADITSINGNLATKADASALNDIYTKTQADDKATEIAAGEVSKYDATLVIGGSNLISGTATLSNTEETYKGGKIYRQHRTASQSGYHDFAVNVTDLDAGDYTLSFDIKASINVPDMLSNQSFFYSPNTTTKVVTSQGYIATGSDGRTEKRVTTSWQRVWITWTQSSAAASKNVIINRIYSSGSDYSVDIANVKFEKGNKATAWTPSSADVQNSINANSTAIQNTNAEVSRVDGVATAANNATTTLAGRVSTVEGAVATKAEAAALTALTTRVTNAEGVNTSQGTAITTLQNTVNHATTGLSTKASSAALTTLDNKVTAVDGRVTTNASNITTLQGEMTAVENGLATKADGSALTALTTRVANAEGGISSQSTALTNLSASLQAQGANLQQDGGFETLTATSGAMSAFTADKYSGSQCLKFVRVAPTGSGGNNDIYWGSLFDVAGSRTYYVEAYVRRDPNETVTPNVNTYFTLGINVLLKVTGAYNWLAAKHVKLAELSNTWSKVSGYVTVPNNYDKGRLWLAFPANANNVQNSSVLIDAVFITDATEGFNAQSTADATSSALTSTNAEVSRINGVVVAQGTSITNLQAGLTTTNNNIATKADGSALSALTTRVSNTETALDTQSTSITNLNSSLATTNTNVATAQQAATNAATLAGGKGKVLVQSTAPAVEDRLAQNLWIDTTSNANTPKRWTGSAWVAVTDKVATDAATAAAAAQATANTKADAAALTSLTTRVNSAEGNITSQGTRVTNLENSVNHATTGLASKASSAALTTLDSKVTSIDGRVTANATSITSLQSGLATANNNIATKADGSAVTALTTRVSSTEGNITSQGSRLTNLENSVNSATNGLATKASSTALDTLSNKVNHSTTGLDAIANKATALETKVNAIKVGGSNLFALKELRRYNAGTLYATTGTYFTVAGTQITGAGMAATDRIGNAIPYTEGQDLTIAFTVVSNITDANIYYRCLNASGAQTKAQTTAVATITGTRYTLTLPASSFPAGTATVNLGFGGTATNPVVKDVVVQLGNMATAWTESYRDSPDMTLYAGAQALTDLTTRVTTAEGKITSQATSITNLSTTVGNQTTSIGTLTTSVNGINASHTVKINNNGYSAGFGLISTGVNGVTTSAFKVDADFFEVGKSGTGIKPFIIVTSANQIIEGVTYPSAGTYINSAKIANATIKLAHIDTASIGSLSAISANLGTIQVGSANIANGAITNAKIGDLQVDTLKIANNAVTVPVYSYTSGIAYIDSSAWITSQSIWAPCSNGVTLFFFNFSYDCRRQDTRYAVKCRILKDGVIVRPEFTIFYFEADANSINVKSRPAGTLSLNHADDTGVDGTFELQFYISAGNGWNVDNRYTSSLTVRK